MKRPIKSEWVVQEGEDTEEMPVGSFLEKSYYVALEKYCEFLETTIQNIENTVGTSDDTAKSCTYTNVPLHD